MLEMDVKKMIVVDLESGSYSMKNIGHELFNLDRNLMDGLFYGYCPPWDGININNFGAKSNEESVEGVLVVYVRKKKGSNNRELIAFCQNAKVFRKKQYNDKLNRIFTNKDGSLTKSSFTIQSDNLYDLRNNYDKFDIIIADYSVHMFRKQRFYGGKYPELDKKIVVYIDNILNGQILLDIDDALVQEAIQDSTPATCEELEKSATKPLIIVNGNHGRLISKNNKISKSALIRAEFKCAIDESHKTFITKNGVSYMEGHHLIPCTVSNSESFMKEFERNIDCVENIVCLCPNCHREVHYGEWNSRSSKIRQLYEQNNKLLEVAGIKITLERLLSLYNNDIT